MLPAQMPDNSDVVITAGDFNDIYRGFTALSKAFDALNRVSTQRKEEFCRNRCELLKRAAIQTREIDTLKQKADDLQTIIFELENSHEEDKKKLREAFAQISELKTCNLQLTQDAARYKEITEKNSESLRLREARHNDILHLANEKETEISALKEELQKQKKLQDKIKTAYYTLEDEYRAVCQKLNAQRENQKSSKEREKFCDGNQKSCCENQKSCGGSCTCQ